MKKIYFAMAVLGTVALVSCEREKSFDELTPIGENGVAFTIGGVSTRSVEAVANVERGVTIPLGTDNEGNDFFLEETIEELNPSPATKGAPAYTVNVGKLYTTMGVYAATGNFGDASFEVMDQFAHEGTPNDGINENGWRYHHNYSADPWPTNKDEDVDFFLRMPAAATGVTNLKYDNQKISFDYSSQANGASQQDILFSHTAISKNDHNGYLPNGAPVLMYHALTGVKFRSGSANGGPTKTIITKVVLSGLNDTGKGTFDPATKTFSWPAEDQDMDLGSFYLDYENTAWSATANKDNTVTYEKDTENPKNNKFGDSWYSAAADKNLNKEDGSLTFWLIPQTITKDVTLKVTFFVKTENTPNGTEITHTIKLGEVLENVQWKAGQLRTYTLDPKDVDVDIFDKMSDLNKSDLEVTNTGNVDEYVRVMLMGNWYGWLPDQDPTKDEPSILVGYASSDLNDYSMVPNWYFKNAPFGNGFDDTFTNGVPQNGNKWILGTGSYYYYPEIIGAGDKLSSSSTLFKSYDLDPDWIPEIWIPVGSERKLAKGVHLVFECAVQAIGAKKPDGSGNYTWQEAWSAATGETIEAK